MKKLFVIAMMSLSLNLMANIEVLPKVSSEIWEAVDLMGKLEDLPIIKADQQKEYFELDKIECVFDYYEACSFFSDINNQRKLIVSMDGAPKLIRGLKRAGVREDHESARLEARNLQCVKNSAQIKCFIVEY